MTPCSEEREQLFGEARQLTIDGREEAPVAAVRATTELRGAQAAAMIIVAREGGIRTHVAGDLLHAQRHTAHPHPNDPRGPGCHCPRKWVNADGLSMMRRLEKRGYVRRDRPGWWVAS